MERRTYGGILRSSNGFPKSVTTYSYKPSAAKTNERVSRTLCQCIEVNHTKRITHGIRTTEMQPLGDDSVISCPLKSFTSCTTHEELHLFGILVIVAEIHVGLQNSDAIYPTS